MEHDCENENRLNKLEKVTEEIYKKLFVGNGKESITTSIAKLEITFSTFSDSLKKFDENQDKIASSLNGINKFVTEIKTKDEIIEKLNKDNNELKKTKDTHKRWLIGISITAFFGFIGLILTLLNYMHEKS